jgi:hypothetical protein
MERGRLPGGESEIGRPVLRVLHDESNSKETDTGTLYKTRK